MEKAIDLISLKRGTTPEDVTRNKRYRTARAAATSAADKIRNGFLNLASLIDKENAKEPADLGPDVDQSNNGKKTKDC